MNHKKYIMDNENLDELYESFKKNKCITFNDCISSDIKKTLTYPKRIQFKIGLFIIIVIFSLFLFISINNGRETTEQHIFEKDVETIISISKDQTINEIGSSYNFSDLLSCTNFGKYSNTLYSIEVDIDNFYIICGYKPNFVGGLKNKMKGKDGFYDDVEWIKYTKKEDIVDQYDNYKICDLYYVYNVIIKNDLLNNKKYNKLIKYYCNVADSYYNGVNIKLKKDMILCYYKEFEYLVNEKLIDNYLNNFIFTGAYELYYDNGNINFVIISKITKLNNMHTINNLELELSDYSSEFYENYIYIMNNYIFKEELNEFSFYIYFRNPLSSTITEEVYLEKIIIPWEIIKNLY